MAGKKKTRLNKRRVIGCVLVFASCLMLISLAGRFYSLYQRSVELTAAREELASLQEECDRIQQDIDLLDDENYLTRYARENWVFTKEGEVVIPLPEDGTSSKTDE